MALFDQFHRIFHDVAFFLFAMLPQPGRRYFVLAQAANDFISRHDNLSREHKNPYKIVPVPHPKSFLPVFSLVATFATFA
jgi:hypothetical protein